MVEKRWSLRRIHHSEVASLLELANKKFPVYRRISEMLELANKKFPVYGRTSEKFVRVDCWARARTRGNKGTNRVPLFFFIQLVAVFVEGEAAKDLPSQMAGCSRQMQMFLRCQKSVGFW